jgi:hypothetical protein
VLGGQDLLDDAAQPRLRPGRAGRLGGDRRAGRGDDTLVDSAVWADRPGVAVIDQAPEPGAAITAAHPLDRAGAGRLTGGG